MAIMAHRLTTDQVAFTVMHELGHARSIILVNSGRKGYGIRRDNSTAGV